MPPHTLPETPRFVDSRLAQTVIGLCTPRVFLSIYGMILFDLVHRVDTFNSVSPRTLALSLRNRASAIAYMPALNIALYRGLDAIRAETALEGFHFLDAGAGKGKMCILAERHAARRGWHWESLTGVELNSTLVPVATENARKMGANARFVASDILDYDDIRPKTVVFAFNPFMEEVMRPFERKLRTIPDLYIIYNNPLHRRVFDDWLPVADHKALAQVLRVAVFRSPASRPGP
jgi:SAM-dependent methyltransferase